MGLDFQTVESIEIYTDSNHQMHFTNFIIPSGNANVKKTQQTAIKFVRIPQNERMILHAHPVAAALAKSPSLGINANNLAN